MERVAGVYAIRHIATGRAYVGGSVSIYHRWYKHKQLMRDGKHDSRYMQAAYEESGLSGLLFEVLEVVTGPDELRVCEQKWADKLEAFGVNGLNNAPSAFNSKGVRVHPLQPPLYRAQHIDGTVVEFANLAHFCEHHGLLYHNMHQLMLRSRGWHKGWRCDKIGAERPQSEIGKPRAPGRWRVFPPEGEPFEIENLNQFCKKNGLSQPSMNRTSKKPETHYRGWRAERLDTLK